MARVRELSDPVAVEMACYHATAPEVSPRNPDIIQWSLYLFYAREPNAPEMTRCDHCGNECSLPFTCQHCGGKFCPDCRLPPGHNCTGLAGWKKRPLPSVGLKYGKDGVTATGGSAGMSRREPAKNVVRGIPFFRIMIAIAILVLLWIAWLVLTGH